MLLNMKLTSSLVKFRLYIISMFNYSSLFSIQAVSLIGRIGTIFDKTVTIISTRIIEAKAIAVSINVGL